jgi:hypothetical protein
MKRHVEEHEDEKEDDRQHDREQQSSFKGRDMSSRQAVIGGTTGAAIAWTAQTASGDATNISSAKATA